MPDILVVYHSMSGNTAAMAEAVAEGTRTIERADAVVKAALDAGTEDLLASDAVAFGSPDYFSDMAGGMKEFFDRTYYPVQGEIDGMPCAIFASAGGSPDIVINALAEMVEKFNFTQVAEPVGASGQPSEADLDNCRQLGKALARAAAGD